MNSTFFSSLANYIKEQWQRFKLGQKILFIVALSSFLIFLLFFIFTSSSSSYVSLFPSERLQPHDVEEITSYLSGANIPFRVKDDSTILVPNDRMHQVRMELASYGLPKIQMNKGYELFDNNTWIKGEKELQILELRALKGQLEQDISHFENIRSANIILDIPTQRPFGGTQQKPKASVILTLRAGARVSPQELRAITYHVAGAVRGITPNMVAISDTSGKLYQSIDPEGEYDVTRSSEMAVEEHLKSKIDGMLAKIAGYEHFFSNVQVTINRDKMTQERKIYSGTVDGINLGNPVVASVSDSNLQETKQTSAQSWILGKRARPISDSEESRGQQYKQLAVPMDSVKIISSPGKIESISVAILMDKNLFESGVLKTDPSIMKTDLENQIATILKGYGVKVHQSVEFVPFDIRIPSSMTVQAVEVKPSTDKSSLLLWLLLALLFLAVVSYFLVTQKTPRYDTAPKQETIEPVKSPSLEETIDSLRKRTESKPAQLALTIRKWLKEEQI